MILRLLPTVLSLEQNFAFYYCIIFYRILLLDWSALL